MRIQFLSLFLFIAQPLFAAEQNPLLDSFLMDLQSYSAELEQELLDAQGQTLEQSRGRVYLSYPGKFHWQYSEPYAQRLITNGKTLWVYDEDLEQVTIKDVENELENTPAAILSGDNQLYDHFTVETLEDAANANTVSLSPKDPESQFHAIHLSIENNLLITMTMFDKLGQVTRITFNNLKRNPTIDSALFDFKAGDDIDVIDSRESVQ